MSSGALVAWVAGCVSVESNAVLVRIAGIRKVYGFMPSVLIPTPLRKLTNELSEVSAAGATVSDVIENLEKAFPGIKDRIYDEAGEVRRFILVHVNGEDIRFLDGVKTAVTDRDEISITPALAGG